MAISSCSSHSLSNPEVAHGFQEHRDSNSSDKELIKPVVHKQQKKYAILIEGRPGWVRSPHSQHSKPWNATGLPEGVAIRGEGGIYYLPKLPPTPTIQPFSYPPKAATPTE